MRTTPNARSALDSGKRGRALTRSLCGTSVENVAARHPLRVSSPIRASALFYADVAWLSHAHYCRCGRGTLCHRTDKMSVVVRFCSTHTGKGESVSKRRMALRTAAILLLGGVAHLLLAREAAADIQYAGGCDWCISNCSQASSNFCYNMSGSCGTGGGQCIVGTCQGLYWGTYPARIRCGGLPNP